ncbi:MAG: archease [Actinomycetota bacterium]
MRTTEEGTGASGYELLDHTADVGIRSWGPSPEAAFEQAAWALVDLLDIGEREPARPGRSVHRRGMPRDSWSIS